MSKIEPLASRCSIFEKGSGEQIIITKDFNLKVNWPKTIHIQMWNFTNIENQLGLLASKILTDKQTWNLTTLWKRITLKMYVCQK